MCKIAGASIQISVILLKPLVFGIIQHHAHAENKHQFQFNNAFDAEEKILYCDKIVEYKIFLLD